MTAGASPVNSAEDYDVFISYRSGHSSRYAEQVKSALHSLSRRHRPEQGIRVFLDKTSLSAGALNDNIKGPLLRSRNLLVLLDTTTAGSPWVNEEISTWLSGGGSPDRLFLIRTDTSLDLAWQDGRFRSQELLPAALAGAFDAEQKWFDVPARRFDDAMLAGLYASVMTMDPEALLLEEARYQQRQRRRSRRILSAVIGLLVVSLVAGTLAALNWRTARAASRQARADADSAYALLSLPVTYPQAVDRAVSASWNSESSSVRAGMLAVAASLRPLGRVVSYPMATDGGTLLGMRLDPFGERLITWGKPAQGTGQEIVVWDVASGSVMQRFTVELDSLEGLVELPRRAYLGCSGRAAIRIDWTTHAVTRLDKHAWAPGSDDSTDFFCSVSPTATSAVVEQGVDSSYWTLFAETIAGATVKREGVSLDEGSTNRLVGLIKEVDESGTFGYGVLGAYGLVQLKLPTDAEFLNQVDNAFFFRSGDAYLAVTITSDSQRKHDLGTHPWAVSATGIVQGIDDTPSLAWINAEGQVAFLHGGSVLLSDPHATASDAPSSPAIVNAAGGVFAIVGRSIWSVTEPDSQDERLKAELVEGTLGEKGASEADVHACDTKLLIGDSYLATGLEYRAPTRLVAGQDPQFENCHVWEHGLPMKLDGAVIADVSAPVLRTTAPDGSIALGDNAGLIQFLNLTSTGAAPWRIYPVKADAPMVTAYGTRRLYVDDSGLVLEGPDGRESFNPGEGAQWFWPRPDGIGGIYQLDKRIYAGQGVSGYQPVVSDCYGTDFSYRPDPGYETDIAKAERQRLVATNKSIDCLTGESVTVADGVEGYSVGPSGGHIIRRILDDQGSRYTTTVWTRESGQPPVTLDVPVHGDGRPVLTLDESGTSLLVGEADVQMVFQYRRDENAWTLVQSYSTSSKPAATTLSPDGTLLVAMGTDGRFDIFDVATGRLLGRETTQFLWGEVDGTLHSLDATESDGLLYVHVYTSQGTATVEIPIGVSRLRELLCGIHRAPSCGPRP